MPQVSRKKAIARRKSRNTNGEFQFIKKSSRISSNDSGFHSLRQLCLNQLNKLNNASDYVMIAKTLCYNGVVSVSIPRNSKKIDNLKVMISNNNNNKSTNLNNYRKSININLQLINEINLFSHQIIKALKLYLLSDAVYLVQASAISVPPHCGFQKVHRDVQFIVGPQHVCSLVLSLSNKKVSTYFIKKSHMETSTTTDHNIPKQLEEVDVTVRSIHNCKSEVVLFDLYIEHFGDQNQTDDYEIDRMFFSFIGSRSEDKFEIIRRQIACEESKDWILLNDN